MATLVMHEPSCGVNDKQRWLPCSCRVQPVTLVNDDLYAKPRILINAGGCVIPVVGDARVSPGVIMFKGEVRSAVDYTAIVETFHELSPKATDMMRPLVPDAKDLVAEFCRELRRRDANRTGLEVCATEHPQGRACCVGGSAYTRSRAYARVDIPHEDVLAKNVDFVRACCFSAARQMAGIAHARAAEQFSSGFAIRLSTDEPVGYLRAFGDEPFAFYDHNTDAISVRLRAYWFATPLGAEDRDEP